MPGLDYSTHTGRAQALAVLIEELATLINAMSRDERRHALFRLLDLASHLWGIAWGCVPHVGHCSRHDHAGDR